MTTTTPPPKRAPRSVRDLPTLTKEPYPYGKVRTEETCSECRKLFLAVIAFDINGNHEIRCPHCGHIHQRVIKNGVMTSDRWGSTIGRPVRSQTYSVWDGDVGRTTSAAQYIKERLLG
jgi:DNA-directed RNA polymerase subunit RPC12/RpoP